MMKLLSGLMDKMDLFNKLLFTRLRTSWTFVFDFKAFYLDQIKHFTKIITNNGFLLITEYLEFGKIKNKTGQ